MMNSKQFLIDFLRGQTKDSNDIILACNDLQRQLFQEIFVGKVSRRVAANISVPPDYRTAAAYLEKKQDLPPWLFILTSQIISKLL